MTYADKGVEPPSSCGHVQWQHLHTCFCPCKPSAVCTGKCVMCTSIRYNHSGSTRRKKKTWRVSTSVAYACRHIRMPTHSRVPLPPRCAHTQASTGQTCIRIITAASALACLRRRKAIQPRGPRPRAHARTPAGGHTCTPAQLIMEAPRGPSSHSSGSHTAPVCTPGIWAQI